MFYSSGASIRKFWEESKWLLLADAVYECDGQSRYLSYDSGSQKIL